MLWLGWGSPPASLSRDGRLVRIARRDLAVLVREHLRCARPRARVGPSAAPWLAGRPDAEGAGPCQDPERASDRWKPACRHWPGTRAPGLDKARILSPRQLLLGFAAAAATYAIGH